MVATLLPAAGISTDGLDVAVGIRASPNARPRWRDGEGLDAAQRRFVLDWSAGRVPVDEAVVGGEAEDAGVLIADEVEARIDGGEGLGQGGGVFVMRALDDVGRTSR